MMKRYIKSNTESQLNSHRFTIQRSGTKFAVNTSHEDDPDSFQFEVQELHPYDDAEYAWAKKASPVEVNLYRNGRRISVIPVPEWDEDQYEDATEYFNECLDITYLALIEANKNVEPRIDRT